MGVGDWDAGGDGAGVPRRQDHGKELALQWGGRGIVSVEETCPDYLSVSVFIAVSIAVSTSSLPISASIHPSFHPSAMWEKDGRGGRVEASRPA